MAGNTFGNLFKITTFGESHGKAIGIVIDGCPSGLKINERFIQKELKRRRPGQSQITTQRNEDDKFEILSGVFNGKTTGTPLTMLIYNLDQHSSDYENIKLKYRPSHADYTYDIKYGIRDFRGGGRSSARETAARVLGGAIAKLFLKKYKISIEAYVSQVGNVSLDKDYTEIDLTQTEKNIVRCPDNETALKMISLIESVRNDGDTIGGTINCVIKNCPAGLGEPVFDKLQAQLARAMLSINAAKG
ncbi:MAG: chorismate synthase, partial [Bacteroidota bacterium]|nr:chorismate synthase [Bacteroidota bacterium]